MASLKKMDKLLLLIWTLILQAAARVSGFNITALKQEISPEITRLQGDGSTIHSSTSSIQLPTGSCRMPPLIRFSPWFDHYEKLVTHSRWIVHYGNERYSQSLGLVSGEIQENAEIPYECRDSSHAEPTSYTLVLAKDRETVCVQLTVAPGNLALLQRWKPNPKPGRLTPEDCADEKLMKGASARWQVRFSGSSFPSVGVECPFTRGTYNLNTSGSDVRCLSSSTAVVDDQISFNGCYSAGNNEKVLGTSLRCLGFVSGVDFDGGRDDLLLLATTHQQSPRFYCARYSVDTEGTVRMSFYLYSPEDALCIPGVSARTTGDLHLAVRMRLKRRLLSVDSTTLPPRPGPTARGTRGIGVMGHCTYPVAWQDGRRWWRGYVSSTTTIQDFYYETFTRDAIVKHRQLMPHTIQDQYICERSSSTSLKSIFLVQNVAFLYECREYLQVGTILLLRWVVRGRAGGMLPTIYDCQDTLAANTMVDVLPQLDSNANIQTMACPFSHTLYQTAIYDESGFSAKGLCEGDSKSTTKITGPIMKISSCLTKDDYAQPYHSEFHCVAAWGPEKMNLAFGTLGESFHHLLLYYAAPTDRPHFYVAKYKVNDDGAIMLSLKANDLQKVRVDLTSTSSTAGDGFIRYHLTPMSEDGATIAPSIGNPFTYPPTPKHVGKVRHLMTTLPVPTFAQTASMFIMRTTQVALPSSSPAPEPTPVAVVHSSTSRPELCLTCQKGVCQVVAGLWACICYVGFTGSDCEIQMSFGRCNFDTCSNGGQCIQEGEFYHCICRQGFLGTVCETGLNCSTSPCLYGDCIQEPFGFHCECYSGYEGPACTQNLLDDPSEQFLRDRTILIILIALLAVLVIAIVVIVTIICQRRRHRDDKSIAVTADGEQVIQKSNSNSNVWFPRYKSHLTPQEDTDSV